MGYLLRKSYRVIDFFIASIIFCISIFFIFVCRLFGRIRIRAAKDRLISITKDSINRILECNGEKYFEWYFARPYAEKIYILYIGTEENRVFKLGKRIIGINRRIPLEKFRGYMPFTATVIQQIIYFIITTKFIIRTHTKVIEIMFPSKNALTAIFLKWMLDIKLVTQIRGNLDLIYFFNPFPSFWPFQMTVQPFETFQVIWDKSIALLFFRSCDLTIGYNVNNMLSGISLGSHPDKTRLSRIKIDLSMLNTVQIHNKDIPKSGKVISLWSRLSPEKLVMEAIQAFEILCAISDDALCFIVIGDGPEFSKIKDYVQNSKFSTQILLTGRKNRDYIAQIAQNSDLAVVPYGGSSLVEAIFLDVPVVAFDIEWHCEVIRNNETGYLADFPDVKHLAKQMHNSLSNPVQSKIMAAAAKKLAIDMFDHERINELESRFYKVLFDE